MPKARPKKADNEAEIEKLTTKIDQASARSKQLKEQVAALSKALTDLAAARAEATKMRQEEHSAFIKNKADLEQGIEGVKLALKALREYYAQKQETSDQGAGA